jgi:hypothetical protein
MKTFKRVAAQGEITIVRVGDVPTRKKLNGDALVLENGRYVIGHSETGHHHVLDRADGVTVSVVDTSEGMRILRAILENPTVLEHQRPYDTHEPLLLAPGEYEFRIGREYDPFEEIMRTQAD